MRSLSGPSAISHPAQAGKPIFEVHIDFLNQRVTKWRRSINLHVWQHRGARSECISWCAGWMECAALTHSASQWDRRLAPCQSGRERERERNGHSSSAMRRHDDSHPWLFSRGFHPSPRTEAHRASSLGLCGNTGGGAASRPAWWTLTPRLHSGDGFVQTWTQTKTDIKIESWFYE